MDTKPISADELYVIVDAHTDESAYPDFNIYTDKQEAQFDCNEANKTASNKYWVTTLQQHMENIYNRSIYLD